MNSELVKTAKGLSKTEGGMDLDSVLDFGSKSLEDLMANFQHIVFLMDGSGSMLHGLGEHAYAANMDGHRKSDLLKKAIKKYIDTKFTEEMRMGLVEFSNYARVIIEAEASKGRLHDTVDNMVFAYGGTYMHRGLRTALSILRKSKNHVPHIVLITDGQAADRGQVVKFIQEEKNQFAVIDCIYIGGNEYTEYKELLQLICRATGGVYEQITSEEEFEKKLLAVAARGLLAAPLQSEVK